MEHKTRKMLALGAVMMLCAVAMIGLGYAAFAGNAKTYNEDNTATVSYITLTPNAENDGSWTPIVNNVEDEFDTYVYNTGTATKTAYYLTDAANDTIDIGTNPVVSYTYKALGSKNFVLTNKTGEDITAVSFDAKATAGIGNATFVYIMGVNDGTTTKYAVLDDSGVQSTTVKNFAFTYQDAAKILNNGTKTYTVSIYIGYEANGSIDQDYPIGVPANAGVEDYDVVTPVAPNASDVPAGFADVDFAFKVTVTSVPHA